jgi:hypothetical protein
VNVRIGFAAVLLLALATACSKTETAPTADAAPAAASAPSAMASASASAAPSAAPATAAPATAESDPLPTHSEAASKVRGDISKANYKAELDKIEKEIE